MRMRSYQVCACGQPLQRADAEVPQPQGREVLLKVLAAGVCHSDLHIWDGYYEIGGGRQLKLTDRGIRLPLTMGHENVGEVIALGPEATGVQVGDIRLAHPWIGCGGCPACRRGEENLCVQPRFLGVFSQGGYASHLLVPEGRHLFPIGRLTPQQAAPLACSGVTAYAALKKVQASLATEPLVVIGAGGVGMMGMALARMMGAQRVVAVDIDPVKRAAALRAGATEAIDGAAPDAATQIQQATGGGAVATIDFVGAGQTVDLAIAAAAKGGSVVVVGLYGGAITLPTPFLPMRALTLRGSYVGSHAELAELLALVNEKGLPPVPITTRPLDEVAEALAELRAGRVVGRVVLAG